MPPSRQQRRATARRTHRSRSITTIVGWLLGGASLAGLILLLRLPESPTRHPLAPDYTLTVRQPPDPVVQLTLDFARQYAARISARGKSIHQHEGLDILVSLHNQFAPRFSSLGVPVHRLGDRPRSYQEEIRPIQEALFARGWEAWVFAPVTYPGTTARIANPRVGQIVAQRSGTITTGRGLQRPYTELLVDTVATVLPGDPWSVTNVRQARITHFITEWNHEASQLALEQTRPLTALPGSPAWLRYHQWVGRLRPSDSIDHWQRLIAPAIIEASSLHERQHLVDTVAAWQVETQDPTRPAIEALTTTVELRGMLREIAASQVPLYVYARRLANVGSRAVDPAYRAAMTQVVRLGYHPTPIDWTTTPLQEAAQTLQQRARRLLHSLDHSL